MPKYGASSDAFTTPITTADTQVALDANAAGEGGEIIELLMTGSGTTTAADTQHRAQLAMCTFGTTGTGSAQTAEPFDQKSQAAELLSTIDFSAEPTTLGTVFPVLFGFNQRGGMRWAVPRGEGVVVHNAETERGACWQVVSAAAGATDAHVHWWE